MHLMNRSRVGGLGALVMVLGLTQVVALQLGLRTADEWADILERDRRVSGLKIEEVVARLGLEPGDQVADIGAGTGVFSGPLAQAVAPGGTLYAVEIDQELLDYVNDRAGRENITNITTVLGEFGDPNLPSRELDLIFFHDVLHHIENRQQYLQVTASYLKPGGRIVVVDMIKGHPEAGHRDQPEMQISPEDVKQWMEAAGLRLVEEVDDLFENKFFVAYGR